MERSKDVALPSTICTVRIAFTFSTRYATKTWKIVESRGVYAIDVGPGVAIYAYLQRLLIEAYSGVGSTCQVHSCVEIARSENLLSRLAASKKVSVSLPTYIFRRITIFRHPCTYNDPLYVSRSTATW